MPNPRKPPMVLWSVTIPEWLAARYTLLTQHPVRGDIIRGSKQSIVVPVLDRLWHAFLQGQSTIDVSDVVAYMQTLAQPEDQSNAPPQ